MNDYYTAEDECLIEIHARFTALDVVLELLDRGIEALVFNG